MGAMGSTSRAAWAVAGREIRSRWGTLLALALLIGVAGGVVLAATAGASRTATAFERFTARSPSPDAFVGGAPDVLELIPDDPAVTDHALLEPAAVSFVEDPSLYMPIAISVDGSLADMANPRVLEGRLPNPEAPDEIALDTKLSERLGAGVGDEIPVVGFTDEDIAVMQESGGEGPPPPPHGPEVTLRVVGLTRHPDDLAVASEDPGLLLLTPAFGEQYGDDVGNFTGGAFMAIQLEGGTGAVPALQDRLEEAVGEEGAFDLQAITSDTRAFEDNVRALATGVLLFGVAAGVAALVTITLVLTRQTANAAVADEQLRALGMTSPERIAALVIPRSLAGVVGGALAVMTAVAVSPRFPIGVARLAEPDPGMDLNVGVLAWGLVAIVVTTVAVSIATGFLATRPHPPSPTRQPLAERLARAPGVPLPITTGIRLALVRGRGTTAVPVWSAIGGITVAVAGVVAALVFGASLTRLVDSPDRWGWTWDLILSGPEAEPTVAAQTDVEEVARVSVVMIEVGDRGVFGYGFESVEGDIKPTVIEGRVPATADEIALGDETLRALGLELGDETEVASPDGPVTMRVVGQAVFPAVGDPIPVADGALLTAEGMRQVDDPEDSEGYSVLAVTWASGRARAQAEEQLPDQLGEPPLGPTLPTDVDRLTQIDRLPGLLATFLGLLAVAALAFTLGSSVRRRTRDLALLKTLGCRRRTVRAAVAWQTAIWVVIGVGLGVPLGVGVGRAAWEAVAGGVGVADDISIPVAPVLIVLVAALVVSELLTAWPARSADRLRAAEALRTE
jgi:hypothetical protein